MSAVIWRVIVRYIGHDIVPAAKVVALFFLVRTAIRLAQRRRAEKSRREIL
jgi:hypothetical protein